VVLLGEDNADAITLPAYLSEAYRLAEQFCKKLGQRLQSAGFLKTLLLRRMGSTVCAGRGTAEKMLADWEHLDEDDDEDEAVDLDAPPPAGKTLTSTETGLLEHLILALEANQERDPKFAVVLDCLRRRGWLDLGCIIFSQYRDSVWWLARALTGDFPAEVIGLYSGPTTSGLIRNGQWTPTNRETIKQLVRRGKLRLFLGTDAASEGLNLQRLARLINLDLPWNPTRLEQRKGCIQRIGQVHDRVEIYNIATRVWSKTGSMSCSPSASRTSTSYSASCPTCWKKPGSPPRSAKRPTPPGLSTPSPRPIPSTCATLASSRSTGNRAP
jgi:hypothetical protein